MLKQNKTYIDMRALCIDLKRESFRYDNSTFEVNGIKVVIKVMPEVMVTSADPVKIERYYWINYIYDTGIESHKIPKSEEEYTKYSEESYQIICECRNAIEDYLIDFVYKNKLVLR